MPAIRIVTDPDCDTNEFCEFEGEIDRLTYAMVESGSRDERIVLRRELMELLHAALSEFDEANRYLVSAAEILCQFDSEKVKRAVARAAARFGAQNEIPRRANLAAAGGTEGRADE